MTTDTATSQLDLVRRQRDHAEAEAHRLSRMLNNPDLLAALVLSAKVLDAWRNHTLQSEVRNVAPELAAALDALHAGPDTHETHQPPATADLDEVTAAIAAADLTWCAELGDPPSEPRYIQALAKGAMRALDAAQPQTCTCCGGDPNTACSACRQHSCWAGEFMCEDSRSAGVTHA
jgi:hypothetical protein